MKKTILALALIALFNIFVFSQVKNITISVDGFTCSLCAKGVEEQFKALDFVSSVKTDLKKASFDISFKKGVEIDIKQIWKAVDDGGFTVGSVKIDAAGTVSKNHKSHVLVTGNSPDLILNGNLDKLNEGDKIIVKGELNSNYGVNVSSFNNN